MSQNKLSKAEMNTRRKFGQDSQMPMIQSLEEKEVKFNTANIILVTSQYDKKSVLFSLLYTK